MGHGLGAAPKMIIVKNRSVGSQWNVYHASLGNTLRLYLNLTLAQQAASSAIWNSTSPTSTVFSLGNDGEINASGQNLIAYCFTDIKGFSKFGSYTGNGSTDGTFVYTGFRPAFVMIKRTDSASQWVVLDSKRNTFNLANLELYPNASDAEATGSRSIDILSNGFKVRTSGSDINGSGGTMIYMCFAENPFVTSGGIPVTAR